MKLPMLGEAGCNEVMAIVSGGSGGGCAKAETAEIGVGVVAVAVPIAACSMSV